MSKSGYSYIHKAWKRPKERLGMVLKKRFIKWRRQHTIERVEKPTRLDRARALGYKAKKGFVLARVRIKKGGRRRRLYGRRGRKPKKAGLVKFTTKQSLKAIAEQKANRRFKNLEVIGSYYVGEDGTHGYFEILMADPKHPNIINDPKINWICKPVHRKRALRGLTFSQKKARGLK